MSLSELVRRRRRRRGARAAVIAALALVMAGATLPAAAADGTPGSQDGRLVGKLVMPKGSDKDTWQELTRRQLKSDDGEKSTRTLHEAAHEQRKATVASQNDEPEPPPAQRTKAAYDYYSWDQCRAHDPGDDNEQEVRRKNHFAFCLVSRPTYRFYRYIWGRPVLVGEYQFRLTMLGRGERGVQRIRFDLELDDWDGWGIRDSKAPLGIRLSCLNLVNAECDEIGGGRQDTISGWQFNGNAYASFITTRSEGGGDGVHYDQDRVNYHDMRIRLTSATGSTQFEEPFRCDAAAYASGGGCIFDQVPATMHYSLNGAGVDSVAAHIKKAQDDPANVYPGGVGTEIPGARKSGKPLTRLYPGMDEEARLYYNANNRVVRTTCRERDPNWGTPGMQCDEYPFRSTWEGAHYTEVQPGARWKYSARMVDGEENGNAGSALGAWYTEDHILAKDAFWVQINP
ncbi:NucA/NucB deoxyribonuclease domain-containing protein [Streptomyces winkii]|uniref:NucA/NucB deoxyribonuclease domain-containing protein n=1 Tax=Streptomyces winkii TaxID=3051178 RepID=UPI0028D6DE1D|nr:hypothetical protein [Streptomyces sp. DSM 40971]